MSKRSKQIRRDRYYAQNIKALMVLAARLGLKAQPSQNCDECDWGHGRHWKKKRHEWSFWSYSYTEDGCEADWCVCGYCLPERYRIEMSGANYWGTRVAMRRLREQERNYQWSRQRST